MAKKTQAELQSDIDTLLVANNTGAVAVTELNVLMTDITESVDTRVDQVIEVNSIADLPDAVGGVITLPAENNRYRINQFIDLGNARLVFAGDNTRAVLRSCPFLFYKVS